MKTVGGVASFGTVVGGLLIADRTRSSDPLDPGDILLRNRDDSRRSVSTTVHWYGPDGTSDGRQLFQRDDSLDPGGTQVLEDALDREGRYGVAARTDADRSDRSGCVLVWNDEGTRRGMGVRVTVHDGSDVVGGRHMHDGEPVLVALSDDPHRRELRRTCPPE